MKQHGYQIKQNSVENGRKHCGKKCKQADRANIFTELSHIDLACTGEKHEAQNSIHQVFFESKVSQSAYKFINGFNLQKLTHYEQHHGDDE